MSAIYLCWKELIDRLGGLFCFSFAVAGRCRYNIATVITIEEILEKIKQDKFEFSQHALDRTIIRRITVQEIKEAIANGEIIEDYPNDKYGPSCLIFGSTLTNRALHIQCSYPSRPLIKIITLYEPDPKRWINLKVRRPKDEA